MILEYSEFLDVISDQHDLSGVVLILKNKILLVKPKKFKRKKKKWSIPKGHVENGDILKSALDELREESRIILPPDRLLSAPSDKLVYFKNGVQKDLNYFVVKIKKKELNVKLFNNMILGNYLKGETREAGFFSKSDAMKLIEPNQKRLLKYID